MTVFLCTRTRPILTGVIGRTIVSVVTSQGIKRVGTSDGRGARIVGARISIVARPRPRLAGFAQAFVVSGAQVVVVAAKRTDDSARRLTFIRRQGYTQPIPRGATTKRILAAHAALASRIVTPWSAFCRVAGYADRRGNTAVGTVALFDRTRIVVVRARDHAAPLARECRGAGIERGAGVAVVARPPVPHVHADSIKTGIGGAGILVVA